MATEPIELLTNEQMAAADRLAVEAGVASLTLMENAGRAVADEAVKMVDAGARIVVLCGPGNNGGDGFVAARYLKERGYEVAVQLLGERGSLKGDAAENAKRWSEMGNIHELDASGLEGAALLIDALFGTGLRRPIRAGSHLAGIIASAEAIGVQVLAVDVPSGLAEDFATETSFRADATVTFFRRKIVHALYPGRDLCGRVVLADIGIPEAVLEELEHHYFSNDPSLWGGDLPWPLRAGHKYDRGHGVVVSGPAHATGAARLGARAALRVGAGLVTVASPEEAVAANAAHLTAVMLAPFLPPEGLAELLSDTRRNAVLIGPGVGVSDASRRMVEIVLRSGTAAVLDADAITVFAGEVGSLRQQIEGRGERPVVLTPHRGELFRLIPKLQSRGYTNLGLARMAADGTNAVVVSKGPDTVVSNNDAVRTSVINENAPPWLATAGSGDVLAGLITGLLAQGMPAFAASCAAVWIHGACAARFGPGLISEDLPEVVPSVLSDLYAMKTGS